MRQSGEPGAGPFFDGSLEHDDREVSKITGKKNANDSAVYLMDTNNQPRNTRPANAEQKQNLINPGILPKDPSLMQPGES